MIRQTYHYAFMHQYSSSKNCVHYANALAILVRDHMLDYMLVYTTSHTKFEK